MTTRAVPIAAGWRVTMIGLPIVIAAIAISPRLATAGAVPVGLALTLVIVTVTMWPLAFARHWIEASPDALTLRWVPLYRKRIPREQVTGWSVSEDAVSPWRYGGVGLRLASGGTLALVNRRGPVLELEVERYRRYVVALADAEEARAVREFMTDWAPAGAATG